MKDTETELCLQNYTSTMSIPTNSSRGPHLGFDPAFDYSQSDSTKTKLALLVIHLLNEMYGGENENEEELTFNEVLGLSLYEGLIQTQDIECILEGLNMTSNSATVKIPRP